MLKYKTRPQLFPELEDMISKGEDPVPDGKTEIDWPILHRRKTNWPKREFEIEPGEADSVHYDFIIDNDVKVVSIYSTFDHIKKDNNPIAWEATTIYEIK